MCFSNKSNIDASKSYRELQTTDDGIQEDDLEKMSNATATATDPFNQHDYSINLHMESMRLNADYPMKPERRTSLGGCNKNTVEAHAEHIISGVENWQQSEYYDQNNLCEEESLRKTHSPVQELLLSDYQTKEMHDVRVELQDDIAPEIDESLIQAGKQYKHDFISYDYDKFNSSFANNSVINNDNDNEGSATYIGNNNDNIANNTLTKTRNNGPSITLSPDSEMPNDVQYSSLAKQTNEKFISHNNNALATATNDFRDDNDVNSKNILPKDLASEDLMKKSDDVRKISDKLEAFNKNNEMSNIPKKISRPKIEETEMPTKGVVSNLKSLFENNAVHNNNDTCKSASYKLEYGVGRSSGTLNKGVFH